MRRPAEYSSIHKGIYNPIRFKTTPNTPFREQINTLRHTRHEPRDKEAAKRRSIGEIDLYNGISVQNVFDFQARGRHKTHFQSERLKQISSSKKIQITEPSEGTNLLAKRGLYGQDRYNTGILPYSSQGVTSQISILSS